MPKIKRPEGHHTITPGFGVPHGAMNALCLPPALEFNRTHAPEAVTRFGAALRGDAVERTRGLAQLGGFPEYGFKHIGRYISETRQIVVARDPKNVVQQEQDLIDWGLVDRHGHLLGLAHRGLPRFLGAASFNYVQPK